MCYFKKITYTTVFKLSDRAETTRVKIWDKIVLL